MEQLRRQKGELREEFKVIHDMLYGMLRANTKGEKYKFAVNFVRLLIQTYKQGTSDPEHMNAFVNTWGNMHGVTSKLFHYNVHGMPPIHYDADNENEGAISAEMQRKLQDHEIKEKPWLNLALYWVYAAYEIWRKSSDIEEEKVHHIINVRDNGSCLYQCIAYSLMWIYDVNQVPRTLLDLKKDLLGKIFGVEIEDGQSLESHRNEKAVHEFNNAVKISAGQEITLGFVAEYLGLVNRDGQIMQHASKWGDDFIMDLASIAYEVQILVYACDNLQDISRNGSSKQALLRHATDREIGEDAVFVGKPVIIILQSYSNYPKPTSHFMIVSRYPLLEGVRENGIGPRGSPIPESIQVKYPEYNEQDMDAKLRKVQELPQMQRCLACNKLVQLDG